MKIAEVCLALLVCVGVSGCGASLQELSSHHVWERAVCEARDPDERAAVRAGIEEDQQLAIAIQAVPEARIAEVSGQADNPLADLVLVRQRTVLTAVPLRSTKVRVALTTAGRRREPRELEMSEVLARTGETIPGPRTVHGTRSTMSGGEFLLRLGLGVMTVGLSELFIRSSGVGARDEAHTYVVHPSESEIRAAAPAASAVVTAASASEVDSFLLFERPADRTRRSIVVHVRYTGVDQHHRDCALEEDLVLSLADELAIEDAIAQRFGHREHTLAQLRAMARE